MDIPKTFNNLTAITYFGKPLTVYCDSNCNKAWGYNSRPIKKEIDTEVIYYKDEELELAPEDPGTYEGGEAKPDSPSLFPNKWCVRECERCHFLH